MGTKNGDVRLRPYNEEVHRGSPTPTGVDPHRAGPRVVARCDQRRAFIGVSSALRTVPREPRVAEAHVLLDASDSNHMGARIPRWYPEMDINRIFLGRIFGWTECYIKKTGPGEAPEAEMLPLAQARADCADWAMANIQSAYSRATCTMLATASSIGVRLNFRTSL